MPSFARRLWKWTAAALAGVLIILAIGVGVFRAAVPLVPEWRADAEAMAERALGWPVHIGSMDLRWAVFGPELVLTDIQLLAPDTHQPLVSAAELDIVFSPRDIFQEGIPRPSHVRLHQPTLALERGENGELFLSGYALPAGNGSRVDWREVLDLGLRHGRLSILDGELHYRDTARGIDDWVLQLSDLTLASDGERHELDGDIIPPGALGERVRLAFSAHGPAATPEDWQWTLDLEASELRLDTWYRQLGWTGNRVMQGALNVTGALNGTGIETIAGTGTAEATALNAIPAEPAAGPIDATAALDRIAFHWRFSVTAAGFDADVRELAIEHGGVRQADGSMFLRTGGADYPVEIAGARLPLAALSDVVRYLPDTGDEKLAAWRKTVNALALSGTIDELTAGFDADATPMRFMVNGRFSDIGAHPREDVPGFRGISGSIRGNETRGEFHIDSRNVQLDFGALFRSPLPAAELRAALEWQAAEAGWTITGTDILIRNPEATATAEFALNLPAEGVPTIDLAAVARDVDLDARSRWLPTGIMTEPLVHWLDTAILAGHVPEARLTLRGPLRGFPYRDGSGVFDVRFMMEDTAIAYAPDWPAVHGLRADVHFDGPALNIRIDSARVENLAVNEGTAHFADLHDAELAVSAEVDGDLADAWRFLSASPLEDALHGVLDALEPAGAMRATVALDIPLRTVHDTAVRVDANLHNADVQVVSLPWRVTGLSGLVRVTDSAVTADELTGALTGAPFTAAIAAGDPVEPDGFSSSVISMRGRSPVTAFDEFLPPAWLSRLDGAFDWNAELRIPGGGAPSALRIDSTLDGVTSTLPAPLDALHPASAKIVLPGDGPIDATIDMPNLGMARLEFIDTPDGRRFSRGRVQAATRDAPQLPAEPGLLLEGRVPALDVRGWLALDDSTAAAAESGKAGSDAVLRGFDLHAVRFLSGDLVLAEQALRGVRLPPVADAPPGGEGGWEISLAGPATGSLRIPADDSAWEIRLERLHIPEEETEGVPAAPHEPPDPRELPALSIDIGDLRIGARQLGHVSGSLQRTAVGYTTQDLRARAPGFAIDLEGRWEVIKDEHYTSVTSELVTGDLGDALRRLGYQDAGMDADSGRIEANLAWHAAPMQPDYGLLEGTVTFSASDGSLREVNPGAGRLIGLLSIAALPRRLMLDFSDFFGEGLHFDTMSGEFLVTAGNAYTTNTQLQGPSVSLLLVGRTGLVARDYDQLAIVDPDVSASIPVAGYLAAGPTVGAALLLLSQLLKAPLADMTQVKYRITGSWDDPLVQRVQDNNATNTTPSDR